MHSLLSLIEKDLGKFLAHKRVILADYVNLLNPRFLPVFLFRIANIFFSVGLGIPAKIISLVNQILFGCDIARGAQIKGGLYLPHPSGVVIGEHVRIGCNCIIHQGVTLGARGEDHLLANPIIGNDVEIGTGAKILGGIKIGSFARIGANAVVLHDVPRCGIAVGIPAKVIGFRKDIERSDIA